MEFRLSENSIRPLLCLDELFVGCEALLDTGAALPVWTGEKEMLEYLGGTTLNRIIKFSGFGGETSGELYRMDLCLGDINFPNMPIIYKYDKEIPGYFILSGTMFSKIIITIDINGKVVKMTPINNQKCFNLTVKDSDGHPYILCS